MIGSSVVCLMFLRLLQVTCRLYCLRNHFALVAGTQQQILVNALNKPSLRFDSYHVFHFLLLDITFIKNPPSVFTLQGHKTICRII